MSITEDNTNKDNKYFCNHCKDKNYLIECGCGSCTEIITKRNKYGKIVKYKKNHDKKNLDFSHISGQNSKWYKTGIKYRHNYRYILIPDYYRADKSGYVAEHIYVYQEYHKVCILPGIEIHHIDPVREGYCNNMPWNLITVTRAQHRIIDGLKQSDGWRCSKCGLDTYIKPDGRPMWYNDGAGGKWCDKCYNESTYIKKERKKKDWTGTVCFLCGSDKTGGVTQHGSPNWRRLDGDPKKPICNKCNKKVWRKKQKNK